MFRIILGFNYTGTSITLAEEFDTLDAANDWVDKLSTWHDCAGNNISFSVTFIQK